MTPQKALDELARKNVAPVYVIAGPERTMVSRLLEAVRNATVGPGPRGLAEDHFDAQQTRAGVVLDAARSLPMLSRWRLVLVRGADLWKAEDLEALLPYLEKPTPSTALVLVGEKFDGRTRFGQALKKKNLLLECLAPTEAELVPWLEGEAKRRGAALAAGAAPALALYIGTDAAALSDALDRLQLYALGRAITEDDVETVVAPLREAGQFDLPEAVADRDLPRALSLLDNLLRQKKPGLLLLTFVSLQFRKVSRARDALDRGDDPGSALRGRMPPQAISRVVSQAKRWSAPQLLRALRLFAEADRKLKSGGGRDREARVLEELLLALHGAPGLGEGPAPRTAPSGPGHARP